MIKTVIVIFLYAVGITLVLGLNPERIATDIMDFLKPKNTLREEVKELRGNKKRHKIYTRLWTLKNVLADTNKSKQFNIICSSSLFLAFSGFLVGRIINNVFLIPVLSIAFALLPFLYINRTLEYYEKHLKEELETALSVITTSYIRNDDIISAVNENLRYIKPPLKKSFEEFSIETASVSADIKRAIRNLKSSVEDEIFKEWCDILILCQDDRTLKDTLLPTVGKLTDVRVVNSELKTMLSSARNEYYVMALMLISTIPLLYALNRDWFDTLIYTFPGKLTVGICGAVILVTALLMFKFTKPIEYKR